MTAPHRSLRDSPDDRLLVLAMRGPEPHQATEEFYRRFLPGLVDLARRHRVDPAERRTIAADVLADVVVALSSAVTPVPRSIAAYLAVALRNAVQSRRRTEERRQRREGGGHPPSLAGGADAERHPDVPVHPEEAGCSAYSQSLTHEPGMDQPGVEPAVRRLADALAERAGEEDLRLLLWLGHGVPARVAAEWLDIGYEAAVKRASRLRSRLRVAAIEYALQLTGPDRRAVHQFLRRAGVISRAVAEHTADPYRATESAPGHEDPAP